MILSMALGWLINFFLIVWWSERARREGYYTALDHVEQLTRNGAMPLAQALVELKEENEKY